jgi:hypothetical protein
MKEFFLRAMKPIFSLLRYLTWRLAILGLSRQVVRGMEVVSIAEAHDLARPISKLGDALELIAVHDPLRFERLRKNIRRVLLSDGVGPEYITSIGACILSVAFVENASTVQLALTLVHEATHARLWRAHIGRRLAKRDQLEHVCIKSERQFGERLRGADRLAALAVVDAELVGSKWWSRDALIQRRANEMRSLGLPAWLIQLSRHLRR